MSKIIRGFKTWCKRHSIACLITATLLLSFCVGAGYIRAGDVGLVNPLVGQFQNTPPVADSRFETSTEFTSLIAKVKPSVVAVNTTVVTDDIFGHQVTEHLSGSGWIYDSQGLIVTNNHVVHGASLVEVTLADGRTFTAQKVSTDTVNDLAVIEIGADNLPALNEGDSSRSAVGSHVFALGNAMGEEIMAAEGVISSVHVTFSAGNEKLYNLLQTTVPITHGDSGGPLFNTDGEVIGIDTAARLNTGSPVPVSYAIAIDTASPVIRQLVSDGCVAHAWLGIGVSSVTDACAAGCAVPFDDGAYVVQVTDGSPAAKAGIVPGDIITKFGNTAIANADEMVIAVRCSCIGQPVCVTVCRNGEMLTFAVTPAGDQS